MSKLYKGEEYITSGEAAKFLSTSPATLLKWKKEYNLVSRPFPGEGGRLFYKKVEIEQLKEDLGR